MPNDGRKQGVPRHRVLSKATANSCEKAIETRTRRACDKEILGLLPYRLQFCDDCTYILTDCQCEED